MFFFFMVRIFIYKTCSISGVEGWHKKDCEGVMANEGMPLLHTVILHYHLGLGRIKVRMLLDLS